MTELRSEVTVGQQISYFPDRTKLKGVTHGWRRHWWSSLMRTCLLSFSGGLDSLAAALLLKEQGWDVTLGHLEWLIEGEGFGEAQTAAARKLAVELDMPLKVLGTMWWPKGSYAKYSWVPVCISTIMHHAGDGCVYPGPMLHRYDAVGFGFDGLDYEGQEVGLTAKQGWIQGMKEYAYQGEVLYPCNGLSRWWDDYGFIPERLAKMAVSCYQGMVGDEACKGCPKCER
jgi:hypothetical protein